MSNLLQDLNPAQRQAVTTTEGPLLVVAGAGTGKTRVITYRVAYLIEQRKARPEEILAVTFTNKAADEMRERISRLLGAPMQAPWASTFHSFCARLLRREAPALGLPRDFSIYDDSDQERIVRALLKEFGEDDRAWVARAILERISRSKTDGRTPDDWHASANPQERRHAEVFARYQQALRETHALDFDDLLLEAVRALTANPEVRARWQRRFRYLHVDEYQDTNPPQYQLVRWLANEQRNVCVVGDEDQSIYAWRGADYGNIFRFEQDFPGARVILLEQNYRSTQPILDVATAVIQNNQSRKGKVLWTEAKRGARVRFCEAATARDEAQFVAERIWNLTRKEPGRRLAVLYRTNAQSRLYEEALRALSVGYRVVGGFSFYKRAEVRDLLAYLRAARNASDEQSLLRIVNMPPRGIGPTTLEALQADARERGQTLADALAHTSNPKLVRFRELIARLRGATSEKPLSEAMEFVLAESGYGRWLEEQDTPEADGRLENLKELVVAAAESEARGESADEFLDRAALVSDADEYDPEAAVTLMTLHSAKGTEFDVVFLVGMEEGLLPHSRSLDSEAGIEEERRLCYVGMTRAKQELWLLRARWRRAWAGEMGEDSEPSRFLLEIPEPLLERLGGEAPAAAAEKGGWTYEAETEPRRWKPRNGRGAASHRKPRRLTEEEEAIPRRPRPRDVRFPPGSTVRHSKFGKGTVLSIDGDGAERKILVHFFNYGRKKLLEKYAGLERI
ncbi:MAG: UvrD-helicase domain-containing protein [Acidobacteria bacterium]|nr:UvrD-helicase domain-containing protein [Acidobacteriota bacterium]